MLDTEPTGAGGHVTRGGGGLVRVCRGGAQREGCRDERGEGRRFVMVCSPSRTATVLGPAVSFRVARFASDQLAATHWYPGAAGGRGC